MNSAECFLQGFFDGVSFVIEKVTPLTEQPVAYYQGFGQAIETLMAAFPAAQPAARLSLNELSAITGLSVPHLCQIIKRGVLPKGEKVGRERLLPAAESLRILCSNHEPYSHWMRP